MDSLDTQELNRLTEWLKAQGFTAEKILECFKYIAEASESEEEM